MDRGVAAYQLIKASVVWLAAGTGKVEKGVHIMDGNNQAFLEPGYYIESSAPAVMSLAKHTVAGLTTKKDKAIALFDMVRDTIRYDPYSMSLNEEDYMATNILERPGNWCVPKAILLTALARAAGIPTAVGFADVRNHLNTKKLRSLMGSDLFIYHGYAAFWLDGKWVKATPAFNMEMCNRFGVRPLVFDGVHETLFHEFNANDDRHMEYVNDRGIFTDAPVKEIIVEMKRQYPNLVAALENDPKSEKITDKLFQHN